MNIQADSHWTNYYNQDKDFALIPSQALTDILSHLEATHGSSCLDIGCGTGQLTRELFHRGYDCTGIDVSTAAINKARNNTSATNITYLHFDIETDKLGDLTLSRYDLTTCELVYAFIDNKEKFIDTIHSLLKENGASIIITPTYTNETDAKPISVDYIKTEAFLKMNFNDVRSYELMKNLHYFVCK